ncbi:MAG TPA: tRNA 2-thiouridine(34) synthase MnmA, partial [Acidimicrobiales bacterium]|nr:tRNA 2-thiouridine(34) synthase MnmA [Acidimicrobiales bacterium]
LAAMSGGVDSSVAAARLLAAGHDVVGVTMKLWGGESDTGCCSVSDVDDARRVAQQLGIAHHVWTFTDDFERRVVEPYVDGHRLGVTPNPCIECNRHLKFDRLLRRARAVGFDAVATGHHARIVARPDGSQRLARGADVAKDQSYVLYVLGPAELARTLLPVGTSTKAEVRAEAEALGLRTADKPDSQDVCFVTSTAGRRGFLGRRLELRPGRIVDEAGRDVGFVDAVELVTVGQRRGLGLAGGGAPRYVVDVDVPAATVRVGPEAGLLCEEVALHRTVWADGAATAGAGRLSGARYAAQCSAHGAPRPARVVAVDGDRAVVRFERPQRRVAPGQSVVLYEGDEVAGGGIVAA